MRFLSASSSGISSRISFGSRLASDGWPVISAWALMSNVKSGGVRSSHDLAHVAVRQGVVGGIHLDDRELVGVEAEPILGGGGIRRVEDARLRSWSDRSRRRSRCGRCRRRPSAADGVRWRWPHRGWPRRPALDRGRWPCGKCRHGHGPMLRHAVGSEGMLRSVSAALAALRRVFANRDIRRAEIAWMLGYAAEWAWLVALFVYAFGVGGVASVGLVGLVRTAACRRAGTALSSLTDRLPRHRVLLAVYAGRAALIGLAAIAVASAWPTWVVFAIAPVDGAAGGAAPPHLHGAAAFARALARGAGGQQRGQRHDGRPGHADRSGDRRGAVDRWPASARRSPCPRRALRWRPGMAFGIRPAQRLRAARSGTHWLVACCSAESRRWPSTGMPPCCSRLFGGADPGPRHAERAAGRRLGGAARPGRGRAGAC